MKKLFFIICFLFLLMPLKSEALRLYSSGFELQTTTSGVEWDTTTGSPTIDTTLKRSGAASLRANPTAATAYMQHTYSSANPSYDHFFRFYLHINSAPADDQEKIFALQDAASSTASVRLNSNRTLELWDDDGDESPAQVGSDSSALSLNTWYRVEVWFNYIAASDNEIYAYIDGVEFASSTDVGIGAVIIADQPNRVQIGAIDTQTSDLYFDDIAINNNSGSYQVSLIGPGKIVHIYPDSAGDTNTFNAGDYSSVDEKPTPDDATSYAEADDNNDILDVNCESSATAGIGSSDAVTLVQVGVRHRPETAASAAITPRIKSEAEGTVESGTAFSHNDTTWKTNGDTTPLNYKLASYVDPQNAGAWTPVLLDTMQIGVIVTDAAPDMYVSSIWALVEYVPAAQYSVYYSVGQNATDHKTGSPTLTIDGSGVGTFSVEQTATNMGVGDRVSYGSSDATSTAYISGKQSGTVWTLVTATGSTPTATTSSPVLSITHEYTSLSTAEAGASDSDHLNTLDLTSGGGYILNFPCYYDSGSDGTAVTVAGWTDGPTTYIKIYTPNDTSTEVNQTQRHSGVWDNTKYNLVAGPTALTLTNNYVRIEGLQLNKTGVGAGRGVAHTTNVNYGEIHISYNIIKLAVIIDSNYMNGIFIYPGDTRLGKVSKIWNNIVYGFNSNANCRGIFSGRNTTFIYNNTAFNNSTAYEELYSLNTVYNNIAASSTVGFSGTWDTAGYNASELGDAPGAGSQNGLATFVNTTVGSEDLHLDSSDTIAIDNGTTSPDSILFSDDIDGVTRSGTWDIGADEYVGEAPPAAASTPIIIRQNVIFRNNVIFK